MRHSLLSARRLVVLLGLVLLTLPATGCRKPAASGAETAAGRPTAGASAFDAETTDVARLLAGMRPLRPSVYTSLTGLQEWRDWESEAGEQWKGYLDERVTPVRAWADKALQTAGSRCQTLLVPFSGTQFMNAYQLAPSCEGYVLAGTEPIGQLPSFDALAAAQFAGLADDVRRLFPEVFPKTRVPGPGHSTPHEGPRLAGAIPSLLVQLARMEARIVSASRFDLTIDGRPLEAIPIKGGNARPAALSLTFEVPNGHPQSLVYLPAELDDAAIRRRPGVWTFLRLQAPFVTLLVPRPAAASDRCALLRELVLAQSSAIIEAAPPWTPVAAADWSATSVTPPATPSFPKGAAVTLAVRRTPPTGAAGR